MQPGAGQRWLYAQYCQAGAERAAMIRLALGVQDITISDVERLDTMFPHAVHIDAHCCRASARRICARPCARPRS